MKRTISVVVQFYFFDIVFNGYSILENYFYIFIVI